MENRNLEKALDIVSKLITGEELTERGDNSSLYQEYNNNAEIYDIVHMSLKKLNLSIYEYNNGLYVRHRNDVVAYDRRGGSLWCPLRADQYQPD